MNINADLLLPYFPLGCALYLIASLFVSMVDDIKSYESKATLFIFGPVLMLASYICMVGVICCVLIILGLVNP